MSVTVTKVPCSLCNREAEAYSSDGKEAFVCKTCVYYQSLHDNNVEHPQFKDTCLQCKKTVTEKEEKKESAEELRKSETTTPTEEEEAVPEQPEEELVPAKPKKKGGWLW